MRRRLMWGLGTIIVGAGAYASSLIASPADKFTGTTIAVAQFDEINVNNFSKPANFWQTRLKTQGLSDVYVQANLWTPGGTTGWHTHPGHSLIIVTAGTVTVYDGDDPTCTPKVYSQGMGFVDSGGGDVHVIRNEGSVDARTVAVQMIPAAAARRIDAAAPGNCPF